MERQHNGRQDPQRVERRRWFRDELPAAADWSAERAKLPAVDVDELLAELPDDETPTA